MRLQDSSFLPSDLPGLVRQLTTLWRQLSDWSRSVLQDVDTTTLANGSLLQYDSASTTWKSTVAPTINGQPIGYRNMPYTGAAGDYTFVADDAGKYRAKTGTAAANYTCNASIFAAGDALYVLNNGTTGAITLIAGAGVTMRLTGTATTGNRTIAALGRATIFWSAPNVCWVDGPGVT